MQKPYTNGKADYDSRSGYYSSVWMPYNMNFPSSTLYHVYTVSIFCAVRSASPPASAEPSMAPHPKSFMDVNILDLFIAS